MDSKKWDSTVGLVACSKGKRQRWPKIKDKLRRKRKKTEVGSGGQAWGAGYFEACNAKMSKKWNEDRPYNERMAKIAEEQLAQDNRYIHPGGQDSLENAQSGALMAVTRNLGILFYNQ